MERNTFTPSQIADMLGMKTSSIYALISRRYLLANKVGRKRYISQTQLDQYLLTRGYNDVIDYTKKGNDLVIR